MVGQRTSCRTRVGRRSREWSTRGRAGRDGGARWDYIYDLPRAPKPTDDDDAGPPLPMDSGRRRTRRSRLPLLRAPRSLPRLRRRAHSMPHLPRRRGQAFSVQQPGPPRVIVRDVIPPHATAPAQAAICFTLAQRCGCEAGCGARTRTHTTSAAPARPHDDDGRRAGGSPSVERGASTQRMRSAGGRTKRGARSHPHPAAQHSAAATTGRIGVRGTTDHALGPGRRW